MVSIKTFFIVFLFALLCFKAGAQETLYSFEEIQSSEAELLKNLYTIKIIQRAYAGQPFPSFSKITDDHLNALFGAIVSFKKDNSSWVAGDSLANQLSNPQIFKILRGKFLELLERTLVKELEYDPELYACLYYVMPRVVVDFRDILEKKILLLSPELRNQLLKRFYRYPFSKGGHKDGYLKQVDRRYQLSFKDPKPGDLSILGKKYAPGMTFYSQSYTILGNFSLLDTPYNINASSVFQFFSGMSLCKEPYALLSRDLKRLFPNTLKTQRMDIERRLLAAAKQLERVSQNYLIQNFIPRDQLDSFSNLEFFGFGFPVYVDKENKVDFRKTDQPVYILEKNLLSPHEYRESFIKPGGTPQQFHTHPDLPRRDKVPAPIFPIRLYFSTVLFPAHTLYKIPSIHESLYREEMNKIITDMINILSTAKFPKEKESQGTDNSEVILRKNIEASEQKARIAREKAIVDIKAANPQTQIIRSNQAIHAGIGKRTQDANQAEKSKDIVNIDQNTGSELSQAVTSAVENLAQQLFKR